MTPQEKLAQQIQALEALAAIDRNLRQLETHINEGQGSLDTLRQELGYLETRLAADQKSIDEMQHTASELSTEARQMGVQLDKSRDKLGRARNDREAVNAEREQEELRRMQRDREEEVTKLNGLLEVARKSVTEVQAKRDKVQRELSATEGSTSSTLTDVRQEHETRRVERAEAAKKLPTPLLRRYEAVLKKKGSAIARTTDGTCQACHVALPPQFFQKVQRRETFEECPMCHRIIYFWYEANP
jgi:uncharacterized protein